MPGRASLPDWYDDLDATFQAAWLRLAGGASDRRSGFHHPVIATAGLDGAPRQRVMVLRAVDQDAGQLRLHTDSRSLKVAEIARDRRVSLLAYDPAEKIQIRIEGMAQLHADDAIADAAWAKSRALSRQCYGTLPAPGVPIATGGAFALPDERNEEALAAGRAHFTALVITARRLEWLYLAIAGHRRAVFQREDGTGPDRGKWQGNWLAP